MLTTRSDAASVNAKWREFIPRLEKRKFSFRLRLILFINALLRQLWLDWATKTDRLHGPTTCLQLNTEKIPLGAFSKGTPGKLTCWLVLHTVAFMAEWGAGKRIILISKSLV